MRRDFELVRNILLAIAQDDIKDSDTLQERLNINVDTLEYHLALLTNDVNLLRAGSGGNMALGSTEKYPKLKDISLTWQGNDFLDAISDEKAWSKVKQGLKSGAKIATIEALKQVAKGVGSAGLAVILAENESDLKGIISTPASDN